MSFCGLNNVTHKEIVNDMVQQGFLEKHEEKWGKKIIINYKIAPNGVDILTKLFAPYEKLFPRDGSKAQTSYDNGDMI